MTPRLKFLLERLRTWGLGFAATFSRSGRSFAGLPLRPWIALLTVGFVLAALVGNAPALLQLSLDSQGWLWLLLGVGVAGISLLVNGWAWGVVMTWRGLRPRWQPVVALHAATNLRKYLPGGIWHLTSRVQALRDGSAPLLDQPVGTVQALVVTLLDPLLAAVAALALVPLGGWQHGLALVCLLPLLALRPRWLQPLLERLERQRARQLDLLPELQLELESGTAAAGIQEYPLGPLLAELIFVLLRFGSFFCCVWAFDLQLNLSSPIWLAAFVLAWTAGLVVPGAPGGLGVFEAVLLLRLALELPQPAVLAVALSYRVVVTLADGLVAGLIALDQRFTRHGGSSQ